MGTIVFDGTSSRNFGLEVEKYPAIIRAKKRLSKYTIPGRNGALILDERASDDYVQPYDIFAGDGSDGSTGPSFDAITDWLLGSSGYQRLEDSYDTRHYRLAYIEGPLEIEDAFTRYGRCRIEFVCDPRRFLKAGEEPRTYAAGGTFLNPTPYAAKPIITVYGSGEGYVSAGGATLYMSITDGMTVDSEKESAYLGAANLNNTVSGSYPVLPAGENAITFGGGVTSIVVIPNTWRY